MSRPTPSSLRRLSLVLVGAVAAVSSACGSDDGATSTIETATTAAPVTTAASGEATGTTTADAVVTPDTTGPRTVDHVFGSTEVPASPQRIVALSEEFLLADLLAIGVEPVASTSNDPSGFSGIDPAATADIEVLASAEFNLEQLAALRPDLLVAYPSYIELVGYDTLSAVAPTVAIGDDDSDWRERLQLTADVFGLGEVAGERIDAIEADLEAARTALDGVTMSALSVSPGPFIRAYTDDRTILTELMVDELGIELVPGPGTDGTDDNGRIELSLEQLGVLQGDVILLLQATIVEGQDAAVATVVASPLWSTLPAVRADRVVTLDQLAYPGASGAAAFATDLAEAATP
jgi:iron complex transport system substrate-binding protein